MFDPEPPIIKTQEGRSIWIRIYKPFFPIWLPYFFMFFRNALLGGQGSKILLPAKAGVFV